MRRATCPYCRATVIAGVDDLGIEVMLDPTTLSSRGEALAVLDRRATFTLDQPRRRTTREAWRRTAAHIGRTELVSPVHAEHRCHHPIPHGWTPPPPPPRDDNQEPMW